MTSLEEAESQLAELQLLVSMFPGEKELQVDQIAFDQLRTSIEEQSDRFHSNSRPSLSIRVITHPSPSSPHTQVGVTLSCTYPLNYPTVLPELAVRCSELSRAQHSQLISDLSAYLRQVCDGGVCVLLAVDWLRENTHLYLSAAAGGERHSPAVQERESFTRLWIYSHHIYNRSKRRSLITWARDLQLSGFSLPGKPGVVCVEGLQPNADEFWTRVKALTWKRILIRHREDIALDGFGGPDALRKFSGFEEAAFYPHGTRGNHMDLGQLFQFLSDRGCAEIFQMFFGVEGR